MSKKEQLEAEIASLEKELDNVHGTGCEVWSRVVGYHRPVKYWNKGKREEFKERKDFVIGV